jgi:hypothetical protein
LGESGYIIYIFIYLIFFFFSIKKKKNQIKPPSPGIPISQQFLSYKNKRLDDEETLTHYEITKGSVVDILPSSLQIVVKTYTGKKLTLDVNVGNTILSVKKKIEDREGVCECVCGCVCVCTYQCMYLLGVRVDVWVCICDGEYGK